jgi:hypothetical protein
MAEGRRLRRYGPVRRRALSQPTFFENFLLGLAFAAGMHRLCGWDAQVVSLPGGQKKIEAGPRERALLTMRA